MSQEIAKRYEQRLKTYYQQVSSDNGQQQEHINKQKVRQWLRLVFEDQQIVVDENVLMIKQKFDEQFNGWIERYLQQVVQIDTQRVSQVQFAYQQCVGLLEWLITQFTKSQHEENHQNEEINNQQEKNLTQEKDQHQNNLNNVNNQNNNQQEQQQQQQQNHQQTNNNRQQQQKQKRLQSKQQQKNLNEVHDITINDHKNNNTGVQFAQLLQKTKQQANQILNQFSQPHQTNSIIQKLKHNNTQNVMKLPQQDQKYKQYLQTIFQHYCKINFGLSKDNTFQSMQKHVSIITINKFMIFINDFEIPLLIIASMPKQGKQKPNKIQVRNILMDVFKKNSQFHKQMNFQQFMQAINKIGENCFAQMKEHQLSQSHQKTTKFSYQMVKMLKYLEISNFKEFKQKMTKLNINFSLRFNKQLQEKKIPVNYKFKYETSEENKKIQHLAKPPTPITKRFSQRREGEQNFKKQKHLLEIAKPPINPKLSAKNMPTMNVQNGSVRQRRGGSTKLLPSQFNQKSTEVQRKDRNIIPFQNTKKSGKSVEKLSHPSHPPQPVIEGYVNIHLAKKGLLSLDQNNKNSVVGMRKKGEFQLNNVIEQAKKQTQAKVYYDYQDSRSGRAMSNLSGSKPLSQYSRDPISNQSYRINNNVRDDLQVELLQNNNTKSSKLIGMSNNPGQLQKSRLDPHNQLRGLIDFNESDQDEYLDQHLKKEKDHDTEMGMRVEKKISQFNYKI